MTFLSSPDPGYEMYGFDRAEFEYLLCCHGKTIDGVELASVAQPVPVQIEWARELIGIPGFTIKEAAALICGLDPFDRGWVTDDESRKLDIALRLLNAALNRGDLSRVGQDEGGNPLLNADDLRCWCPTVDRVWPIPDATGKVHGMATDTELLAMLRESEQRAVAAEARLRAAGELADTTKELRKQIVGLMADVARLEVEREILDAPHNVTPTTEKPEKQLGTRERTSYLNIIGVMLEQLTTGRANDTTVIKQAIANHGTKQGISERKLQEAFAAAKRSLGAS